MYQSRLDLLCIIILIISHLPLGKSSCPTPKSDPLAPALYVFGDSLVDNGNNNLLPTFGKANYAPYGGDFPCPVSLGRFTNGRTPADFIAEYLGLSSYPPPFASLLNRIGVPSPTPYFNLSESESYGYNYASAMCGILRVTGSIGGKCCSLDEQIDMFKVTLELQLSPKLKNEIEVSRHLSKSIFFVSVGNNDYMNNYLYHIFKQNPSQFAQLLLDPFSRQLQRLYDLGARKVVVTDIGPIGCIPIMVRARKHEGKCDEDLNNAASTYNKLLPSMLKNLTSTLEGAHFIIASTYSSIYDAVTNPAKYGFRDSSNPCCTTWLNGTLTCIPELKPCSDPDQHYFWDGFHPTEAAYSYLAKQCIHGSSVCVPMNLEQLVQV